MSQCGFIGLFAVSMRLIMESESKLANQRLENILILKVT